MRVCLNPFVKPDKKPRESAKAGSITFRPDADVRQMLDLAADALGDTTSELINEAARMALPMVIKSRLDAKTSALERLRESFKPAALKRSRDDE